MKLIWMCGQSCAGKTYLSTRWGNEFKDVEVLHIGEALREKYGEEDIRNKKSPLAPEEFDQEVSNMIRNLSNSQKEWGVVDSIKSPSQLNWVQAFGGAVVIVRCNVDVLLKRVKKRTGSSRSLLNEVFQTSFIASHNVLRRCWEKEIPWLMLDNSEKNNLCPSWGDLMCSLDNIKSI